MNLLFTRTQMNASALSIIPLRIGGTVTFRLKTELELSQEERILARKYSLTRATLLRSKDDDDLGRAYRPALFLAVMITLAFAMLVPSGLFAGSGGGMFGPGSGGILIKTALVPIVWLGSFVVLTCLYYFSLRTHVSVDQLTDGGRMFYCHSVVELDEQEAELLDICRRFYLTLEKAKNWGGREINPLPDGEPFYLNDPKGSHRKVALDRAMEQAGQVTRKLLTPFTVNGRTPEGGAAASASQGRPDQNTPRSSGNNDTSSGGSGSSSGQGSGSGSGSTSGSGGVPFPPRFDGGDAGGGVPAGPPSDPTPPAPSSGGEAVQIPQEPMAAPTPNTPPSRTAGAPPPPVPRAPISPIPASSVPPPAFRSDGAAGAVSSAPREPSRPSAPSATPDPMPMPSIPSNPAPVQARSPGGSNAPTDPSPVPSQNASAQPQHPPHPLAPHPLAPKSPKPGDDGSGGSSGDTGSGGTGRGGSNNPGF